MSTQLAGALGLAVIAAAYALESFHILPAGTGQSALTLVMTAFAFLHVPLKVVPGAPPATQSTEQPGAVPAGAIRVGRQEKP